MKGGKRNQVDSKDINTLRQTLEYIDSESQLIRKQISEIQFASINETNFTSVSVNVKSISD